MSAALIITPLILWAALIQFGEHAPNQLLKMVAIPLIATLFFVTAAVIFMASLGTKRVYFDVEDVA